MSERFIPEHRRTQFKAKNTFKPDELRRRREEQQVEIRKQKREENLAKKRGIAGVGGNQPGASLGASIDSDDEGGSIESQVRSLSPVPHSLHSLHVGPVIGPVTWLGPTYGLSSSKSAISWLCTRLCGEHTMLTLSRSSRQNSLRWSKECSPKR